jgi:hypothetical protein
VEGVVQRQNRGEKDKWKRLNRAVKCMLKFEKRRTWEKFVVDLQKET